MSINEKFFLTLSFSFNSSSNFCQLINDLQDDLHSSLFCLRRHPTCNRSLGCRPSTLVHQRRIRRERRIGREWMAARSRKRGRGAPGWCRFWTPCPSELLEWLGLLNFAFENFSYCIFVLILDITRGCSGQSVRRENIWTVQRTKHFDGFFRGWFISFLASFACWFGLILFSFLSCLVIFIGWLAAAVFLSTLLQPGKIVGVVTLWRGNLLQPSLSPWTSGRIDGWGRCLPGTFLYFGLS